MCRRKQLKRVGLALPFGMDVRVNFGWSATYLAMQQQIPAELRLEPLLVDDAQWNQDVIDAWLKTWQPDAVLTLNWKNKWSEDLLDKKNTSTTTRPLIINLDISPGDNACGIDQQHERPRNFSSVNYPFSAEGNRIIFSFFLI